MSNPPDNYPCKCGHLKSEHGHSKGLMSNSFETSCLILNKNKTAYACPGCMYFKSDNLKYLEQMSLQKDIKEILNIPLEIPLK